MIRSLGWFLGGAYIGTFAFLAISDIGQQYGDDPWIMDWSMVAVIVLAFTLPFVLGIMANAHVEEK